MELILHTAAEVFRNVPTICGKRAGVDSRYWYIRCT